MSLFIPPAVSQQIRDLGLSEWIIEDVFNTGSLRTGLNKKFKRYEHQGYTVQVTFDHKDTGEDVITHVSKW